MNQENKKILLYFEIAVKQHKDFLKELEKFPYLLRQMYILQGDKLRRV